MLEDVGDGAAHLVGQDLTYLVIFALDATALTFCASEHHLQVNDSLMLDGLAVLEENVRLLMSVSFVGHIIESVIFGADEDPIGLLDAPD